MGDSTIRKRFIFLIILVALAYSGLSQTIQWNSDLITPNSSSNLQEPTVLTVEVLENKSAGWFRARIVLNVTTDIAINMSYFISGMGTNAEKILTVNSSVFIVSNSSSEIEIFIRAHGMVFPTSFQYQMTLFYINATTQIPQNIFEIPLGEFTIIMGVPLSIILGGVLVLGVIIIVFRPVRLRKGKEESSTETSYDYSPATPSTATSTSISPSISSTQMQSGQIRCPECKEKITEGSAFCPECGYHIPRFLRTSE